MYKIFFFVFVWGYSTLYAQICQEYIYTGTNKWYVDEHSWNTSDTDPNVQLQNSIDLVYATIFQSPDSFKKLGLSSDKTQDCWQQTQEKALFFRRLYLFLGLSDFRYSHIPNDPNKACSWPFPLATALTQGQRVMIILEGVALRDFLAFLSGGFNHIYYKRSFSSHGVKWSKKHSCFKEIKLKSSFRYFAHNEGNLGMDFSLGGVGSSLPSGSIVALNGQELCTKTRSIFNKRQLGHLLIFWKQFPKMNKSVVLIGIEGCAPGSTNIFGCHHNVFSGFVDQKIRRSSTGGSKWNLLNLGVPPPAEYGGKSLVVNEALFAELTKKINMFLEQSEESQQRIFKIILPKDAVFARKFLSSYNQWAP